MMNEQIRQMLAEADYDKLEELEAIALAEGNRQLARVINEELKSRAADVADAVDNIIRALDLEEEEEE